MRPIHLKWSSLLLVGILVLTSYSLRPVYTRPIGPEKDKIGFIGDSITYRTSRGDVVDAEMAILKKYVSVNRGKSGSTTTDWQPGHTLFDDTLEVFKTKNVRTVSIMLGTNDARRDRATPPAVYYHNLKRITEGLLASGVVRLVILNYPPYAVPGSFNRWDDMSVVYLRQYGEQIDRLAKENGVAKGDTSAFAYFKQHPYQLADGVHPDVFGDKALGKLWAEAYRRVVNDENSQRRSALIADLFAGMPSI